MYSRSLVTRHEWVVVYRDEGPKRSEAAIK